MLAIVRNSSCSCYCYRLSSNAINFCTLTSLSSCFMPCQSATLPIDHLNTMVDVKVVQYATNIFCRILCYTFSIMFQERIIFISYSINTLVNLFVYITDCFCDQNQLLWRDQMKRTNVRTEVLGAVAMSSSLLNQVEELRLLRFLLNPAILTLPLTGCWV